MANPVDPIRGVDHGDVSSLHESNGEALSDVSSTQRLHLSVHVT